MSSATTRTREGQQLARLERVVDTVYAVVLVLLVALAPTPRDVGWRDESLLGFFVDQGDALFVVVIGIALVILYWTQGNAIFYRLARADTTFSSLALVQLVMLLLYLYVAGITVDVGITPEALAFQSLFLLLMGVLSIAAWSYASRNGRLVTDDTTPQIAREQRLKMLPEPITVAVTLACAPFGNTVWSLAWLTLPVAVFAVNRLGRAGAGPARSPGSSGTR